MKLHQIITINRSFIALILFLLNTFQSYAVVPDCTMNPDVSFNSGSGFDRFVSSIAVQSDGKIIVAGGSKYNGTVVNNLVRLNVDGTIDRTFNTGTGFDLPVNKVKITPDGKILAGGQFTRYNGESQKYLVRLNANGSIDRTFSLTGTGLNSFVNDFVFQSDGKYIVTGNFITYNGLSRVGILRLNSNGSLDESFDPGTSASEQRVIVSTRVSSPSSINAIALQSDNKVILGGGFKSFNGIDAGHVVRLNVNGTVDRSFNTVAGIDRMSSDGIHPGHSISVSFIELQNDGKIVLTGYFGGYNGTPVYNIVRLNSDGGLDPTYLCGRGFVGPVYGGVSLSDDKILVFGNYNTYNGRPVSNICVLNTNGTATPMRMGFLFDAAISVATVNNSGNIFVGGAFTSYCNRTGLFGRFAKLKCGDWTQQQPQQPQQPQTCVSPKPTRINAKPSIPICNGQNVSLSVNPSSPSLGSWVWYQGGCGMGEPIGRGASVNVSPAVTTTYFVRAEGACPNPGECISVVVNVLTPNSFPPIQGPDVMTRRLGATATARLIPPIPGGRWSSSNESLARVNNDGIVSVPPLSLGNSVVISYTFTDPKNKCKVVLTHKIQIK